MHLTDEQLNEYLDNETTERLQIESHLSSCGECAARLTALQTLFNEIESLPELELTHSIAARFVSTSLNAGIPTPNLPAQLPRWLTLTVILQAAVALTAIIFTAPYMSRFITPFFQASSIPLWNDVALELQTTFTVTMQLFYSISLPEIPSNILTLPAELTPEILSISVIGMLLAWALGNWWLLHKKTKFFV